jgi:hypothetical protein
MATKKQQAEHDRALKRIAAANAGLQAQVTGDLGFSRVRVCHGTTIVPGGEGDERVENHPEASQHVGVSASGGDEIVIHTATALQMEALGQVEILERVADPEEDEE